MSDDQEHAESAGEVHDLAGQRAWGPAVGVGSFVTINFGGSRQNSTGMTLGEYHLWVYGATWILRRGHDVLATSNDSRGAMERAVAELEGKCATGVELDTSDLSLEIAFDDQLLFRAAPTPDPEMEHWMLYLPDGSVISAGPGTTLTREPGDSSAPLGD